MNATTRLVVLLALAGCALGFMEKHYGDVYAHFRAEPLDFSEQDLVLLADAFHIESHFQDQKASLLNGIQNCITNATNQTGTIGNLIDSTQGLIRVVKDAATQLSNPGTLISSTISNTLKSGWSKLFGRLLQTNDKGAVAKFVDSLEYKVAEAKVEQKQITSALSNSSKFLGALQGIGQLLSGNTSGFKTTLSKYFPSWFGSSLRRLGIEHHEGMFDFLSGANQETAAASQASWLDNLKAKIGQEAVKSALGFSSSPGNTTGVFDSLKAKLSQQALGSFLGGNAQPQPQAPLNVQPQVAPAAAPSQWDTAKSWVSKLSNLYQTSSAHLEHLAEQPDMSRGRHRKSLYQQQAEKHRLAKMAGSLKNAAHYLNSVDDDSLNFNRLENHLYDLVTEGGATGKAYLRGVETLKCILLKINCPQTRVIPSGYTKNIYFGQNQAAQVKSLSGNAGGAAVQAVNNVLVNNGLNTIVQSGSANQIELAHVDPGILSGQFNFDSVSQTSGFNPSQGNEAIIVSNESPIVRLPPISDVVSGVQYTTVINQAATPAASNDFVIGVASPEVKSAAQTSTFNIIAPVTADQGSVAYTINADGSGTAANADSSLTLQAAAPAAQRASARPLYTIDTASAEDSWSASEPTISYAANANSGANTSTTTTKTYTVQSKPASLINSSTANQNNAISLSGMTLNSIPASQWQKISGAAAENLSWNDPEPEPVLVYEAHRSAPASA